MDFQCVRVWNPEEEAGSCQQLAVGYLVIHRKGEREDEIGLPASRGSFYRIYESL